MMISETRAGGHDPAADEAEVRALFQRMVTEWNRGDAAAFAAVFTEDSDYVPFDGSHLRGRTANADLHAELFASVLAGSRLVGEVASVRFVTPDVAVMHTTGAVLLAWQRRPAPSRRSIQTLVAVRRAEGFRFAAFHNTRVTKLPGPLGRWLFARVVAAYRALSRAPAA